MFNGSGRGFINASKISQAREMIFVVETDFEIDESRVTCHYHEK